jgi:poly(hydroxyalkanoate) depolymerase family esterase
MKTTPLLDHLRTAASLTRAGRLTEATALIRQSLYGGAAPTGAHGGGGGGARGDAAAEVIDEQEAPSDLSARTIVADLTRRFAERFTPPGTAAADATPAPRHGLRSGMPFEMPLKPSSQPHVPAAGRFIEGSFANAAGSRSYKLFIPSAYAGQPLPLVVMLHGCKQSPDDFANGTQMNSAAERRNCFVLYPAQTTADNASACWNWFRREDQVRERGEPSILADMVRSVIAEYGIDRDQVFAAGLSAGGAMAAVLAVTYPELFAAVGVHSGLACGAAGDLPSALAAMRGMPHSVAAAGGAGGGAMPAIVFHGDHDRTVHPHNGAEVVRTLGDQAAAANATVEQGQAPGGHRYTRTLHRNQDGRTVLEYWVVHGGGHAWFGGSVQGSYCDPKGPDATEEMMRFFLRPCAERARCG